MRSSVGFMLLLSATTSMADQSSHDVAGVFWSLSDVTTEEYQATAFGIGVSGSKSITDWIYAGGSIQRQGVTYDIDDSTNYIDGSINGFSGLLGVDQPLSNTVSMLAEIEYSSATSYLTYHRYPQNDTSDSSTISGISTNLGISLGHQPVMLTLGINEGLSGDLADSDTDFGAILRYSSPNDVFTDFNYSFSKDSSTIGARIGIYH